MRSRPRDQSVAELDVVQPLPTFGGEFVKKTLLGSLLCLTLLSVCTLGFAADKATHPGYAAGVVQKGHPYVDPDAGVKKLFSNFGPDPADLYDASNGYF